MSEEFAAAPGLRVSLFSDRTAFALALDRLADESCARVSAALPLRANLDALQNIALIRLYRKQAGSLAAERSARELLQRFGAAGVSDKRDADMTTRERFIVLLARALMLERPRLVIDQPSALLYDEPYPGLIRELRRCAGGDKEWEIYDYAWNRVLYE